MIPRWRLPVLVAGLAVLGYGTALLVSGGSPAPVAAVVVWLAGALVAHDLVLAPLTLVLGGFVLRRLDGPSRRVTAAGLLVAGCLVLVAVPALLTPGVPDNLTTTPRNYALGLAVLLALDAAVTVALALVLGRATRHLVADRPTGDQ